MVALSLGGLVLIGGRLMIEQVASVSERIAKVERASDDKLGRHASVRALLLQVDADSVAGGTFTGTTESARFVSWCDAPGGWQERCAAAIQVVSGPRSGLQVRTSVGQLLHLDDSTKMQLRYMAPADAGLSWVTSWDSSLVPPVAVGVVSARDTLILRIGVRR